MFEKFGGSVTNGLLGMMWCVKEKELEQKRVCE